MRFTKRERDDLLLSWLAISLAFTIALSMGSNASTTWLRNLVISLITAGLGFLVHELAHKLVAEREGCSAAYRANKPMLLIALVSALFQIVIAAPGAVHISGHPNAAQRGRTALAGPAANLALALSFLILTLVTTGMFRQAMFFGSMINAWLGLFNLMPFPPLDGEKVLSWNKIAYGVTVSVGVLIAVLNGTP